MFSCTKKIQTPIPLVEISNGNIMSILLCQQKVKKMHIFCLRKNALFSKDFASEIDLSVLNAIPHVSGSRNVSGIDSTHPNWAQRLSSASDIDSGPVSGQIYPILLMHQRSQICPRDQKLQSKYQKLSNEPTWAPGHGRMPLSGIQRWVSWFKKKNAKMHYFSPFWAIFEGISAKNGNFRQKIAHAAL